MSTPSVSVRDLAKNYGEVPALRGISFEVAAGEIYGLLGPNGAGKTTAMECILGLRQPASGTISINGLDPARNPRAVRQSVGAQLQTAQLQDKLKVREALALFGSFYSHPAMPEKLLERFELSEKAEASFQSLSGGQRQRLFLALALVNDPKVVLFDEPTAGLDPKSRQELHQLIRGLRAEGRTILLTTHYLDEAEKLCDRVGILHHGRIVAEDTPAGLVQRSNCESRLTLRCANAVDSSEITKLPGVTRCTAGGAAVSLLTHDAAKTIGALGQHLALEGNTLLDLQVTPPSLEEAFLQITGENWKEDLASAD
jgi:ABC-2 type transport system ATP-binding protein